MEYVLYYFIVKVKVQEEEVSNLKFVSFFKVCFSFVFFSKFGLIQCRFVCEIL